MFVCLSGVVKGVFLAWYGRDETVFLYKEEKGVEVIIRTRRKCLYKRMGRECI